MNEADILARMHARVEGSRRRGPAAGFSDFNSSSADLYGIANDVQAASNALGTLNPRNPGFFNSLAQSGKRLLQRSLSWYTRSLRSFGVAVSTALQNHTEAINRLACSVEKSERTVQELSRQSQENLLDLERRLQSSLDGVSALAETADTASQRNQGEIQRLRSYLDEQLTGIRSEIHSKAAKLH